MFTKMFKKNPVKRLPLCENSLEGRRFSFFEDIRFGDVYMLFRRENFDDASKFLNLKVSPETREPLYAVDYTYEDGFAVEAGSTVEQLLQAGYLRRIPERNFYAKYAYYRYR